MSSLLQTAISNRQAASHSPAPAGRANKDTVSSKKLAKLSLSSDDEAHSAGNDDDDNDLDNDIEDEEAGDFPENYDDDEDDDEDQMVDLQTRPGTPVPGGAKSAGLPTTGGTSGLRSLTGKFTKDPVSTLSPIYTGGNPAVKLT
ncbi:hypothetical protein QFC22_003863 [Naganishia vaughanmartiniae]|uniref:Uncharacterized protein n=1 Tax=Naganishia vaughanmartiniae TaxID=1424756 RepID=A0ACC2X3R5_9TREE|nr:hypothetical protein QFC22_003863 [Naganishia vaughanmartiniae]